MGGRGASSGISVKSKKYGTQYRTVLEVDNIKFVSKRSRSSEDLLETMTEGRIYVTVGVNDLLRITFFDENNKRNKIIERDKRTEEWHVHKGYYHSEYSDTVHENLTPEDEKILDKVKSIWSNRSRA